MNVVFLVAGASATIASGRVTPVEKVTELLVKIKEKTIAQAKLEKELFQKFDDFCHKQEDDKLWRTSKAAKKVERLDADITEKGTSIDAKQNEITELETKITDEEGEKTTAEGQMDTKSQEDKAALENFDKIISQIKRAIVHLKTSDVSGTGFLELTSLLESSLRIEHPPRALRDLSEQLLLQYKEHEQEKNTPGQPKTYKFHSKVVIDILETLLTQFKNKRLAKDNEALESRAESERVIAASANLIAQYGHQKDELAGEVAALEVEKQQAEADRDLAKKQGDEDTEFAHHLVGCTRFKEYASTEGKTELVTRLEELKTEPVCAETEQNGGECGLKRTNYAKRVKTRDEEITALTKAIELMQGEGGESYKANKRLTALQKQKQQQQQQNKSSSFSQQESHGTAGTDAAAGLVKPHRVVTSLAQEAREQIEKQRDDDMMDDGDTEELDTEGDRDDEDEEETGTATNFMQMSRRKTAKAKLLKFLTLESGRLRSTILSSVLLRIQMGKSDHFKSIRELINNLITKLDEQLESETKMKEWCDTELTREHKGREKERDAIQKAVSNIDSETAKRDLLVKEINELREQIAVDTEAKQKAQALRDEEKEENDRTVADAEEGLEAVKGAIKTLKDFYDANKDNSKSFMQEDLAAGTDEPSELYRAKGAAADGNTIADIRPESDAFDTAYDGNQTESTGVIGILEVIESDYQGTIDQVKQQEVDAAAAWVTKKAEIEQSISDMEGNVVTKTTKKEECETKVTSNEGDLKAAKKLHEGHEKSLRSLKPLCSAPEAGEQLEERRKRREQEVASLREALSILREYS